MVDLANTPTRVRITSRKWDGSFHRDNYANELGADDFGRWLWMGSDEPVATSTGSYLARAGLRLFPPGDVWWSAFFVPRQNETGLPQQEYVDICTPVRSHPNLIEFVDLDLDVERMDGGAVELLDLDEFEQHRVAMGYPATVVDKARSTAAFMFDQLNRRQAPFDGTWKRWWDLVPGAGNSA